MKSLKNLLGWEVWRFRYGEIRRNAGITENFEKYSGKIFSG
jgi:hypothetical protein